MEKTTDNPECRFYTARDIAKITGLSYQYTRQTLVFSPGFPKPKKFGRLNRWSKKAVDQWLDAA